MKLEVTIAAFEAKDQFPFYVTPQHHDTYTPAMVHAWGGVGVLETV